MQASQFGAAASSDFARASWLRFVACLPWILLVWQALWLLHFARSTGWCCDASYYLQTGRILWEQGLYYPDMLAGYRPYLTPLVVGVIGQFPVSTAVICDANLAYSFNAAVLFAAISAGLTLGFSRLLTRRQWLLVSLPTLFNPFFLADLVVPLQESVTLFVALPVLTLVGASLILGRLERVAFLVVALTGFVAMARTSNAIVGAAAAVLCVFLLWHLRHDARRRLRLVVSAAAGIVFAVLLVLPQLSINRHHFGSLVSPHYQEIARLQLEHGADLMRYGTAYEDGEWKGIRLQSAWYDYTPGAAVDHPYENAGWGVVPQVLAHFFAGLHVDEPRTYWSRGRPSGFSAWFVASALMAFLGTIGIARDLRHCPRVGWTLLVLVAVSVASTALLAVESRFGIWGQLGLAMGTARLLFAQPRHPRILQIVLLALAYVAVAMSINLWLWTYA